MAELIITEKPSSAKKVALALGKATQKKHKKVSYYVVKRGDKEIYVVSAVGHLYNLHQKEKGWDYPRYDIEWVASNEINKKQAYVKDYIDCIKKLAKKTKEITVACDYDVEGEVIGMNAMRFAAGAKDAARMKFSTLTKKELEDAYENKSKKINWGQALAGETRHKLDWIYGINISRALTSCVKSAGSFKIMSTGRVQGPALKMLSDKEKEIQAFVPDPFWVITANGMKGRSKIEAVYEKDKVFDKKVADKVFKDTKDATQGNVSKVDTTQRKQPAPHPFDLTTLQTEAYRCFKYTPKRTLAIAQELYLAGVTSYPRTSSQKLDDKLGLKDILKQLATQKEYAELAGKVLKFDTLKPNNGKKDDPAHPAIYPTGQKPEKLEKSSQKLYDLIVKRFLATFAKEATRETISAHIDVNTHSFVCKGTRTVDPQWHEYYAPYVKLDEVTLPEMKEADVIKIKKVVMEEKETKPPRRFNQSSIIKELEKRNLGTKATRADILQRLFDRGYVNGVQITVTDLGLETIKLLEKYMPEIVEEKLTADFEDEMEKVREHKSEPDQIIARAQTHLTALLKGIKKQEVAIGKEIIESIKETRVAAAHARVLGEDKKGRTISVRIGRYGPLAQRQDGENDPEYVALPKGVKIDDVTLEEVLPLFSLPRKIGQYEDMEMTAHIGPYGPYVKWNKKFISIPKELSPYTIKELEAIELVKAKIEADKNRIIKTFDDGTQILNGRYGPYIKKGKKNIKIPKGKKPEELTLEEINEL